MRVRKAKQSEPKARPRQQAAVPLEKVEMMKMMRVVKWLLHRGKAYGENAQPITRQVSFVHHLLAVELSTNR